MNIQDKLDKIHETIWNVNLTDRQKLKQLEELLPKEKAKRVRAKSIKGFFNTNFSPNDDL